MDAVTMDGCRRPAENSVTKRISDWLDETRKSHKSNCSDILCHDLDIDHSSYPLMTRVNSWFHSTVKRQGGKQAITNWLKSLGDNVWDGMTTNQLLMMVQEEIYREETFYELTDYVKTHLESVATQAQVNHIQLKQTVDDWFHEEIKNPEVKQVTVSWLTELGHNVNITTPTSKVLKILVDEIKCDDDFEEIKCEIANNQSATDHAANTINAEHRQLRSRITTWYSENVDTAGSKAAMTSWLEEAGQEVWENMTDTQFLKMLRREIQCELDFDEVKNEVESATGTASNLLNTPTTGRTLITRSLPRRSMTSIGSDFTGQRKSLKLVPNSSFNVSVGTQTTNTRQRYGGQFMKLAGLESRYANLKQTLQKTRQHYLKATEELLKSRHHVKDLEKRISNLNLQCEAKDYKINQLSDSARQYNVKLPSNHSQEVSTEEEIEETNAHRCTTKWIQENKPYLRGVIELNRKELTAMDAGQFGIVFKTQDNFCFKATKNMSKWTEILPEYKVYDYVRYKLFENDVPYSQFLVAHVLGLAYFNDVGGPRYGILMNLYEGPLLMLVEKIQGMADKKDRERFFLDNVMLGMFKAVYQLHKYAQIIHGDIAMRNFLLDAKGRVIITDFGLSHKLKRKTDSSGYYSSYGVPAPSKLPVWWHPPEVVKYVIDGTAPKLSQQTDCYMVGVTCVEMLAHINGKLTHGSKTFIPFRTNLDGQYVGVKSESLITRLYELKSDFGFISTDLHDSCCNSGDYNRVLSLINLIIHPTVELRESIPGMLRCLDPDAPEDCDDDVSLTEELDFYEKNVYLFPDN